MRGSARTCPTPHAACWHIVSGETESCYRRRPGYKKVLLNRSMPSCGAKLGGWLVQPFTKGSVWCGVPDAHCVWSCSSLLRSVSGAGSHLAAAGGNGVKFWRHWIVQDDQLRQLHLQGDMHTTISS